MGLVLIYRTNRVLNFAQGQLGVVAAVFLVKCYYDFGFNYWFALVLALALAAAVGALSRAAAAPAVQPAPGAGDGGHHRPEPGAVRLHRPALHPAQEPLPSRSRCPIDFSFHIGTYLFTPGQVMTLVVAPMVAVGAGRLRPVVAVGAGHAGHGRERRLGPAVGGLGPPHLDGGLDAGRRAVGLHRHPGLARADRVPDRGAQPRAAPAGPDRRPGRGHGQPDRGLRGRHRRGRGPGDPGVEHLQHGPGRPGAVRHACWRCCWSGSPPCRPGPRGEERSTWFENARGQRRTDEPAPSPGRGDRGGG